MAKNITEKLKKKLLNVRYIKKTFFETKKRRANQVENYDRSDHFKSTTPYSRMADSKQTKQL